MTHGNSTISVPLSDEHDLHEVVVFAQDGEGLVWGVVDEIWFSSSAGAPSISTSKQSVGESPRERR